MIMKNLVLIILIVFGAVLLFGCTQTTQPQRATQVTAPSTTATPTSAPTIVKVDEFRNCVDDLKCFQAATRDCIKARYSTAQVSGPFSLTSVSEIHGFDANGMCEMYSNALTKYSGGSIKNQTLEMICLVPKEKLATWNDTPDLKRYCQGNMLEKFK